MVVCWNAYIATIIHFPGYSEKIPFVKPAPIDVEGNKLKKVEDKIVNKTAKINIGDV